MNDQEFKDRLLQELSAIRLAINSADEAITQLNFNMIGAAKMLRDMENDIPEF